MAGFIDRQSWDLSLAVTVFGYDYAAADIRNRGTGGSGFVQRSNRSTCHLPASLTSCYQHQFSTSKLRFGKRCLYCGIRKRCHQR